ncbi:MAG: ABC transporter ATP-binding protein [Clostridia bacterium]|nr:ABC transporter ATP-binding protein [Clostridia bacterium]
MSRCKTNEKHNTKHFSDEEILKREKVLMECYAKNNGHTLKIFFGLFKGDYFRLFLASLFYIIKSSPAWVIPLITADVINLAIYKPENAIWRFALDAVIALVVLAQNIPTHTLYIRFFSLAKRNVEAGLRGAMIRKLQQLNMSFHKEMQSGALQSKIMRDVEAVESFASSVIEVGLNVGINMIITLTVVINKSLPVFFMFLVCVPIAVFVTSKFRIPMRERNRAFRKEIEQTSSDVIEMIEMVPVTRAHSLEDVEIRKLTKEITAVAERGFRLDKIQHLFGSVAWVLFQLFQVLCLFFTGYLAYRGIITQIGDITLYQSYFTSLLGYVNSIIALMPVFARGSEAITSIGEILNAYDIEKNTGKERLKQLDGNYEFRNVRFAYENEAPVLQDLNLTVHAGETVALVGESGAGKSTVLNLLIGFNEILDGEILIDGRSIDSINLRSYRKFLSVVPQKTILFSGTIRENITYGNPRISEKRLWEVIDAANLRSVIEKLPNGLDTQVGEHGDKLSGGQRQRIAIARAIIRNPRVIIFDEATSALDSVSEREIQEAIDNLTRDRTTFIVAHRLSTIRNADKIAVIGEGRCLEYGTYEELMDKKGEFYKLKQVQG